jgi:hypothetical protein
MTERKAGNRRQKPQISGLMCSPQTALGHMTHAYRETTTSTRWRDEQYLVWTSDTDRDQMQLHLGLRSRRLTTQQTTARLQRITIFIYLLFFTLEYGGDQFKFLEKCGTKEYCNLKSTGVQILTE